MRGFPGDSIHGRELFKLGINPDKATLDFHGGMHRVMTTAETNDSTWHVSQPSLTDGRTSYRSQLGQNVNSMWPLQRLFNTVIKSSIDPQGKKCPSKDRDDDGDVVMCDYAAGMLGTLHSKSYRLTMNVESDSKIRPDATASGPSTPCRLGALKELSTTVKERNSLTNLDGRPCQ